MSDDFTETFGFFIKVYDENSPPFGWRAVITKYGADNKISKTIVR